MYAQITTQDVRDETRDRVGFAGGYALSHFGNAQSTAVLLWQGSADAPAEYGPVYRVEDDWTGPDPDAAPQAATLLSFDGPLSDDAFAAAQWAGEHRLGPVLSVLPALVRGFACWDGDRRAMRVVNLATSPEGLEEIGRAANSTTLLPGEDPALLPGPDRVDAYRVVTTYRASAESSTDR